MMLNLQKASFVKRASAFLFDIIIFAVIAVGIAVIISSVLGYDAKVDKLEDAYLQYEEKFDVDFDIKEEDYNKLTDAEKQKYEDASKAIANDDKIAQTYNMIFNLTLVMISLSLLITFLFMELLIPVLLKNGQTLGKKIFGVALMRTDGVKVSFFQVFVRAILGKYTIETMIPALIFMMFIMGSTGPTGIIVIGLILLLEIIVFVATKTNSLIHDLMAVTVAVDMNTQRIFESEDELIEYKKKKAEEAAQQQQY